MYILFVSLVYFVVLSINLTKFCEVYAENKKKKVTIELQKSSKGNQIEKLS